MIKINELIDIDKYDDNEIVIYLDNNRLEATNYRLFLTTLELKEMLKIAESK